MLLASSLLFFLLCLVSCTERVAGVNWQAEPDGSTPDWRPEDYNKDSVRVLTSANFTSAREQHSGMMVAFVAPWCSHSKAFIPQFAHAAEQLVGSSVLLATVDATVETALADEHSVEGYPTVYWWDSQAPGRRREYWVRGNPKASDIVSWVRGRLTEHVHSLEASAAASAWAALHLQGGNLAALLLLPPDGASLIPRLSGIVARLPGHADIAYTFDRAVYVAALARAAAIVNGTETTNDGDGGGEQPAAVLLKPHDERVERVGPLPPAHEVDAFESALYASLSASLLPELVPFDEAHEEMLLQGDATVQLLALGTREEVGQRADELRAVARAFRGRAVVVIVDTDAVETDALKEYLTYERAADGGASYFGLDVASEAQFVPEAVVRALTGDALQAALEAFVAAMLDGTAVERVRSQPVPPSNDGPVTEVVGDTFAALVRQRGVDVLLHVYAPWCGHCKRLEPTYEALGARFASVPSVRIARMDGDANEVPSVAPAAYPSLALYTASNLRIEVTDEVERTLDGLTRFVREHAEVSIDEAAPLDSKEEL